MVFNKNKQMDASLKKKGVGTQVFKRSKIENEMGKLARQSGILFETGKLKLQITQMENDLYNLKAELGDIVYKAFQNQALRGEDEGREIEAVCGKITQLENSVNELKQEVERINRD